MADPYLTREGVLRNLFGLKTQVALDKAESLVVPLNVVKLRKELEDYQGPFDVVLLRLIHKRLFGDLYSWAGDFREVDLRKAQDPDGKIFTRFTGPAQIAGRLEHTFGWIPNREKLKALSPGQVSGKLAVVFSELNMVHPFREGNGRTQRVFLETVANVVGMTFDWDAITRERMVACSIASANGDEGSIPRLFADALDPERASALKKVNRFLQSQLPDWNERYVATTVEGREYTGKLGGAAGDDFIMRVDGERSWFASGKVVDLKGEASKPGEDITFTATEWKPFG